MAARKTASKGGKPDKLMRDALILELHKKVEQKKGPFLKRFRVVARKLIDTAEDGDVQAMKEVFDRVDGKAPQAVVGADGGPIAIEVVKFANDKTA